MCALRQTGQESEEYVGNLVTVHFSAVACRDHIQTVSQVSQDVEVEARKHFFQNDTLAALAGAILGEVVDQGFKLSNVQDGVETRITKYPC